jgi:very-short-patch-repair endonuclease
MRERFDARVLRKRMTPAERRLWSAIRNGTLLGAKFRRQHLVGRFVLDFYCPLAKLAIEVDGEIHTHQAEYDDARTVYLESYGIRVIRFQNDEVLQDLPRVLDRIRVALAPHLTMFASTPHQLEFPDWPIRAAEE